MTRLFIIALAGLTPSLSAAACSGSHVDLRGDFGQVRFSTEIADTPDERSKGLMFREDLPRMGSMLFVYDAPTDPVFWMKNTPLPLDILFFSPEGELTAIQADAIPFDETGLPGGEDVQFVLEIHGGLAERLGIEEGAEIRHPQIGQGGVWPCE